MSQHLTKAEQETVISFSAEGEPAQVYSSMQRVVNKLRKNPAFELEEEGTIGKTAWVRGHLPQRMITLRAGKVSLAASEMKCECGKTFGSKQGFRNHMKREGHGPTTAD